MKTVYLGWDKKLVDAVSDRLLKMGKVWDGVLLIVPTRESGKLLMGALARKAGAVIPPYIVTTEMLLHRAGEDVVYRDMMELWAWGRVLCEAGDLNPLIKDVSLERTSSWGLSVGEMILKTQRELSECGLGFKSLPEHPAVPPSEKARWSVLAKLQEQVNSVLKEIGVGTLLDEKGSVLGEFLPTDVSRVIVACVPDPIPLVMNQLSMLDEAGVISCECWVHAPEEIKVDSWGRPLANQWKADSPDRPVLPLPNFNETVCLSDDPDLLADEIVRFFARSEVSPANAAIGITDDSMTAPVESAVEAAGWPVYLTVGYSSSRMGVVQLLYQIREALLNPVQWRSWNSLCRSLALSVALGLPKPYHFISELDHIMEKHLPDTLDFMATLLEREGRWSGHLAGIRSWVEQWADNGVGKTLIHLIECLRENGWSGPFQDTLLNDLRLLGEWVNRLEEACEDLTALDAMDLLCRSASRLRIYSNRDEKVINMEHWLDLSYDPADCIILAGLHEGAVPDRQVEDTLLPDSLKKSLGLRTREDRYARDAYLLCGMMESRKVQGDVGIFVSRKDSEGNPCLPSSLLFLCEDRELPERVSVLFDESGGEMINREVPDDSGWAYALPEEERRWDAFSPSDLREFLYCPLRFWLRKSGFERLDLSVTAAQSGNALHHCAELLGPGRELDGVTGERELEVRLMEALLAYYDQSFGFQKSLPILIQMDYAKEKVTRLVRQHLMALDEGWEVKAVEEKLEWAPWADLPVMLRMRIDRIEKHRNTGELRIIDFKTSAKAKSPFEAHLSSLTPKREERLRNFLPRLEPIEWQEGRKIKICRWKDLQLPLYVLAGQRVLKERYGGGDVTASYVNLPLTVEGTGYSEWRDLDARLLESAEQWSREIIRYLREVRFEAVPSAEQLGWQLRQNDAFKQLSVDDAKQLFEASELKGGSVE